MRRKILVIVLLAPLIAITASAHDLFLNASATQSTFVLSFKLEIHARRQLNYPVEIIPQSNPYSLKVGQTLPVLCTLDGKPLVNQFVIAGWESADGKLHSLDTRTDAKGIASFKLMGAGKWYVKMIHMTATNEPGINCESKWATLTFQIR